MLKILPLLSILLTFSLRANSNITILAANSNHQVNLPTRVFYTDISPRINDRGDIVFSFLGLESGFVEYGLYFLERANIKGKILQILPQNEVISKVSLNNLGQVLFSVHDNSRTLRVTQFDTLDLSSKNLIVQDNDYKTYVISDINNDGDFAYRLNSDGSRSLHTFIAEGTNLVLREGEFVNKQKINYIHSVKQSGHYLLYKLRYGRIGQYQSSDGEELYLRNTKTNQVRLIAASRNRMPSSKLDSISNHYAVNDHGQVAFFAKRDGKKILLSDVDGVMTVVAKEDGFMKKFDSFSPVINENGQILVRGSFEDGSGLSLYDKKWQRIKLVDKNIIHNSKTYTIVRNSSGLLFKGSPDMNNSGEIVVNTYLKVGNDPLFEGILKINL